MRVFDSFNAFCAELEAFVGFTVYDYRTPPAGVNLPYAVIKEVGDYDFKADNTEYIRRTNIEILLHTFQAGIKSDPEDNRRTTAENKVRSFFKINGIPVTLEDTDFYPDLNLFRTQFSARIWYGTDA
ncbi:MAG: hypothetical protein IKE94_15550 [Aeriscardovia sp.]|nr:hypothetical protein [Aeriscardovia sp.]